MLLKDIKFADIKVLAEKQTGMYVFGEAAKVHLDCKKSAAFPIACGRPVHIYQNISEWENNLESENLNRAARLPYQTNSFKYCSKVKSFYILFCISQKLTLKNSQKFFPVMNPMYDHFLLALLGAKVLRFQLNHWNMRGT